VKAARAVVVMLAVLLQTGFAATAAGAGSRVSEHRHDPCRRHCIPIAAIQSELDAAVAAGVPGVVVFVRSGDQVATITAGVSDVATAKPIRGDDRFRIASITKSFVAALVVRLAQDHLLQLDDSVAPYLPEYALDPAITIRQLLQHTSGLFDIADDGDWIGSILADPTRAWTPEELIPIGLAHPAYFAPGTGFHYSNTGYMLLGALVTRLTHHDVGVELQRRIFRPLDLENTYVSHDATIRGHHAQGYSLSPDGQIIDVTTLNATFTGAAGDIISTVGDVATFYRALLRGRIVQGPYLVDMLSFLDINDDPDDGVALGLFRFPESCGTKTIGHGGGIFGYSSEARNSPDATVQDIAYANTDSIPEAAYPHLATAERLAVCGGS
jgi:D-alanyl-D-alanine carboxypeptidase